MSGPGGNKLFEGYKAENFHVEVAATTTLNPNNHRVHLRIPASTTIVVTLPPVAACYGLYSINLVDLGASGVCTLQDQNESHDWADLTLDATADGVVLFSDGFKWWVVHNTIA